MVGVGGGGDFEERRRLMFVEEEVFRVGEVGGGFLEEGVDVGVEGFMSFNEKRIE